MIESLKKKKILPFTSRKSGEFSKYCLHRRTVSEFEWQKVSVILGLTILTEKKKAIIFIFKEFSDSYLPDSQQAF